MNEHNDNGVPQDSTPEWLPSGAIPMPDPALPPVPPPSPTPYPGEPVGPGSVPVPPFPASPPQPGGPAPYPAEPFPSQPQPGGFPPQQGYYGGPDKRDHPASTTTFILGLLSIIACGLTGPFAWYMGSKARKELNANPNAYGPSNLLTVGWIFGIIGTVMVLASIAFFIIFFGSFLLTAGSMGEFFSELDCSSLYDEGTADYNECRLDEVGFSEDT